MSSKGTVYVGVGIQLPHNSTTRKAPSEISKGLVKGPVVVSCSKSKTTSISYHKAFWLGLLKRMIADSS